MRFLGYLGLLLASADIGTAQIHPRDREISDADTRSWWHTTEALSNDNMEGRDTGSAAYQRAAEYVAKRFASAGLRPAGSNGTWFQNVPMHELSVTPENTSFAFTKTGGATLQLRFLYEITLTPTANMPARLDASLTFRGYCGKDAMIDITGKVVICFGTQRTGLPNTGERSANARLGGAVGVISVDDPFFSIEPPRWPYAYARSVTIQDPGGPVTAAANGKPFVSMRLSAEAFAKLVSPTGYDPEALLDAGGHKRPLPSFEIPGRLHAEMHTSQRQLSSPNVLGLLPGADPKLKDEYVAVAAHLDGYGFGTPVNGDKLYNGTLDDAAYVALLIQTADDLRDGRENNSTELAANNAVNHGVTLAAPKRSILFCAFTGEEKGLLGSSYFVQHPTVPLNQIVADINLDQLRPLFPLTILTAPGLGLTSLGETAREVGKDMRIELRDDREPERGLLRRADNYPFLHAGVPAIGFVFGFDPGTDAEKRYREWYQVRYHRPQDDLTQPMDFQAATRFNSFLYRLTKTVADNPVRPSILAH